MKPFIYTSVLLFSFVTFLFPAAQAANKSIRVNGGNGFVTLNNSGTGSLLNFSVDSFTLEAWIKPTNFSGVGNVENTIIGSDSLNGFKGFVLRTGVSAKLEFSYGYGNAWQTLTTLTNVLTVNRWTHVAVTKEGGAVSMYINGRLVRDTVFPANIDIIPCNLPVRIGENGSNNNRKFLGNLDEVKIWKEARTMSEIRDDMAEHCTPYPAAMISYFKLDDVSAVNPSTVINAINPLNHGVMNDTIVSENGAWLFNGHGTIYVDSSNTYMGCGSLSGNSWLTAYPDLNTAIHLAHTYPFIEKILVAKGTYVPTQFPYNMQADRSGTQTNYGNLKHKVFHFRTGLEVEGGYPSGGGVRDPYQFKTILSGKGINGVATDSAYRVVLVDTSIYWAQVNDTTKLDGLVIRHARGSLSALSFGAGAVYGAGLFIKNGTNLIRNCSIEYNSGVNNCSGIYGYTGFTVMEHSRVQHNTEGRGFGSDLGSGAPGRLWMRFDTVENNTNGGLRINNWSVIQNCYIHANSSTNGVGAGIQVQGVQHTIENNLVADNRIGTPPNLGQGGGIYFEQSNQDTVIGNTFLNNMAGYAGGGAYVFGGFNHYFENNVFMGDSSHNGSGLYSVNTNTTLISNRFEDNYSWSHGAGFMGNGGNNKLYRNFFKGNFSVVSGGGIRVDGGYDTLIGNAIIANIAGEYGGGLVFGCTYGAVFNNNISLNASGISGGMDVNTTTSSITGNTFYANSGDSTIMPNFYHTGALFINYGNNQVNNNIFWGNHINSATNILCSDYFRWNGTNTFKNNILQLPSNMYTTVGAGQNDIGVASANNLFTTNPQFANALNIPGADNVYNTADDGLRLNPGSPALDAGDSTLKPLFINKDITGNGRVAGPNMDMGAYEQTCVPGNTTTPFAQTVCPGNSTTLMVTATALPSDIFWYADSNSAVSLGNGFSFTTPVINMTDTFWVGNTNCFSTARIPIIVTVSNATPTLSNTTPVANLSICPGNAAVLTVSSNTLADSLFWYADSLSQTVIDTGFVFNSVPLFQADTFWVSAHGCSNTPRMPIAVAVFPNTGGVTAQSSCVNYYWALSGMTYTSSGQYYDSSLNMYGCQQIDTLNLIILPASASSSSQSACMEYLWPQNNQLYTVSGAYHDTVLNAAGCDSIITLNLTIINPNATISQNLNQLSANPAGASYQWIFCNPYQLINGANSQTYTATANSDYAVIVTQNGCADTSACVNVSGLSINGVEHDVVLQISPNPSTGLSLIQFGTTQEFVSIRITNGLGQILRQQQFRQVSQCSVDLSAFPNGLYQVEVMSGQQRWVTLVQKYVP